MCLAIPGQVIEIVAEKMGTDKAKGETMLNFTVPTEYGGADAGKIPTEVFLLPAALTRLALGRPGKEAPASGALLVADLLPERGDQWVALTPRTSACARCGRPSRESSR